MSVNCHNSPPTPFPHYCRFRRSLLSIMSWTAVRFVRIAVVSVLNAVDAAMASCRFFGYENLSMSFEPYDLKLPLTVTSESYCADLNSCRPVAAVITMDYDFRFRPLQTSSNYIPMSYDVKLLRILKTWRPTLELQNPSCLFHVTSSEHCGVELMKSKRWQPAAYVKNGCHEDWLRRAALQPARLRWWIVERLSH